MGKGARDDKAPAFTDHCFTGDYPTRLTDKLEASDLDRTRQLSLLSEPT